jgi:hypothetical protein
VGGGFIQTCILSVSVGVGQILGFRLIELVTSKQRADWRTHKVWHFWTDLLSGSLSLFGVGVGCGAYISIYLSIPIHFYSPWSVWASGVRTKTDTYIMYIHYPSIPFLSFLFAQNASTLDTRLTHWRNRQTDGWTHPSC